MYFEKIEKMFEILYEKYKQGEITESYLNDRCKKIHNFRSDAIRHLRGYTSNILAMSELEEEERRAAITGHIWSHEEIQTKNMLFLDALNENYNERIPEMDSALEGLNMIADEIGAEHPQMQAKDGLEFASRIAEEYASYGDTLERTSTILKRIGIENVPSLHHKYTKDIIKDADKFVKEVENSEQKISLGENFLKGQKIEHVGSRNVIVQDVDYFRTLPQDEQKKPMHGVLEVIDKNTGMLSECMVPMLYLPKRDEYYITKKDFYDALQAHGYIPTAQMKNSKEIIGAIDTHEKKIQKTAPKKDKEIVFKRVDSIMKVYGYSYRDSSSTKRHNIIKSLVKCGKLTKNDVLQYLQGMNQVQLSSIKQKEINKGLLITDPHDAGKKVHSQKVVWAAPNSNYTKWIKRNEEDIDFVNTQIRDISRGTKNIGKQDTGLLLK